MRIARLTSISATAADAAGQEVPGNYVWSGANWYFSSYRPKLNLEVRGDLSKMGRACSVRNQLTDDDRKVILLGYGLNVDVWREVWGDVLRTSPERLEYLATKPGTQNQPQP